MNGILDQPGAYNSGTLGVIQPGAFRSGSLGNVEQPGAYRSGSLGMVPQPGAFRSGSLGNVPQPGAFRSGSLGCGCKPMQGLGSTSRLGNFRSISGLGALPISLDLAVGFALVFGGLYFFEKKAGGG